MILLIKILCYEFSMQIYPMESQILNLQHMAMQDINQLDQLFKSVYKLS